jgi:hypothetical protein
MCLAQWGQITKVVPAWEELVFRLESVQATVRLRLFQVEKIGMTIGWGGQEHGDLGLP